MTQSSAWSPPDIVRFLVESAREKQKEMCVESSGFSTILAKKKDDVRDNEERRPVKLKSSQIK